MVQVDDGVMGAKGAAEVRWVVDIVASCFEIQRIREVELNLGTGVTLVRVTGTITRSQAAGIAACLEQRVDS